MSSLPDFAPTDDSDVRSLARTLTQYDTDELSKDDLDGHIQMSKLEIYNELDIESDDFFTDSGLGQALIASTAIFAKLAVENYSVTRWQVADQEIETDGMSDEESGQLQRWGDLYQSGIRKSDLSSSSGPTNTAGYIG